MLKLSIAALATVAAIAMSFPVAAQSRVLLDTPHRYPLGGGSSESAEVCGSELGYLPRVYPADVAAVTDPNHVWVTEICAGNDMIRNEGNAAFLTPDMKKNKVVNGVIRAAGFFPEDVYAIRKMGDGTIGLFVHAFTRHGADTQVVYAY